MASARNALERLELFIARARQLQDARLLRSGSITSLTVRWNHISGFTKFGSDVDEEDLRSFLTVFRQFMMNDEPTFLFHVYNLCQQYIRSDQLTGWLRQSRDDFSKSLRKTGIGGVVVDGQPLIPERVMDWWINGFYFHNNPDKWKELQKLEAMGMALSKAVFLDFLSTTVLHVLYTAHVITVAFQDSLIDKEKARADFR